MSQLSTPSTHHEFQGTLVLVREVHNFGGFFGGDTVTVTAVPYTAQDDEHTLTIDEKAFTNVRDRYTMTAGMLLALEFAGERVEHAELLGAATQAELRAALGPVVLDGPLDGPRVMSYHCPTCALWIVGAPHDNRCRVCQSEL